MRVVINPVFILLILLAVITVLGLLTAVKAFCLAMTKSNDRKRRKPDVRFKITVFSVILLAVVILFVTIPMNRILFITFAVLVIGIIGVLIVIIIMLIHIINEKTAELEKAAVAELDLSLGKELQKKFLPLDTGPDGNKFNSGCHYTKNAVFFGYYEGAQGISGDYFDFRDLDGRYYAVIKCDVAGKGIPAALLMVQVATMFNNYFKNWKPSVSGMRIEEFVYQINDLTDTLGFKGRFAAFTLCLFDSETGDLHFCNAGDNRIHICDTSEKCVKSITLPQAPAAGILESSMVKSKGGYQVQTITLDHGDILLLYSDGIEESKSSYRQGNEELGAQRVNDIINAVLNRRMYNLHDLCFDYSNCSGTAEDVIMALICAEKMFRCYRNAKVTKNDRVPVDIKIDAFLKKHFLQYQHYCSRTSDPPDNSTYMWYTNLKEVEQYDDLAILGIERK